MSFTYSRTEQGGVSTSQEPEGSNITAAEIARIQDSTNQSVVFQDGESTEKHYYIEVRGNYLYSVNSSQDALNIYDISDLQDPVLVETFEASSQSDVNVLGSFDFLGDTLLLPSNTFESDGSTDTSTNGKIHEIDVSDPEDVSFLGTNDVEQAEPNAVDVQRNRIYTAGRNGAVSLDPSDFSVLSSDLTTGSGKFETIARGDALYNTFFGRNFPLYDISDPTAISASVASISTPNFKTLRDVAVTQSAEYAFGVTGNGVTGTASLVVGDVKDITSKGTNEELRIASLNVSDRNLNTVDIIDGDKLLATDSRTAHVIDVSKPNYPVKVNETSVKLANETKSTELTADSTNQENLTYVGGNDSENRLSVLI